MGSPMFHSMISRAQAATSELVVLIDPSLVLLQDFTIAVTKMRVIQSAWLLVVKPTTMTSFPYNLEGPSQLWVRGDGQDADDNEVSFKDPSPYPLMTYFQRVVYHVNCMLKVYLVVYNVNNL